MNIDRILTIAMLALKKNGIERAEYIKKRKLFYNMGNHCYWHPHSIPIEGYLMNIHNNVYVAGGTTFLTHDVMEDMLTYRAQGKTKYNQYVGGIEVFDNVFIGANCTIMYNVRIGPDAVVAAGSVVTKDVAEGTIVGGNPARVIGSFYELAEKRKNISISKSDGKGKMVEYFWNQYEKR